MVNGALNRIPSREAEIQSTGVDTEINYEETDNIEETTANPTRNTLRLQENATVSDNTEESPSANLLLISQQHQQGLSHLHVEADQNDERLTLHPDTLIALSNFLEEKDKEEQAFESLRRAAEERFRTTDPTDLENNSADINENIQTNTFDPNGEIEDDENFTAPSEAIDTSFHSTMRAFGEHWKLSQFWYNENTATALAQQCHDINGQIAILSAPTLFIKLLSLRPLRHLPILFEFDRRFSVFGQQYRFWNYMDPTESLNENCSNLHKACDLVVCDPPFLSLECCERTCQAIEYLLKPNGKIMYCTGLILAPELERILGCKMTYFRPRHANQLQNDFRCFVNYFDGTGLFAIENDSCSSPSPMTNDTTGTQHLDSPLIITNRKNIHRQSSNDDKKFEVCR